MRFLDVSGEDGIFELRGEVYYGRFDFFVFSDNLFSFMCSKFYERIFFFFFGFETLVVL